MTAIIFVCSIVLNALQFFHSHLHIPSSIVYPTWLRSLSPIHSVSLTLFNRSLIINSLRKWREFARWWKFSQPNLFATAMPFKLSPVASNTLWISLKSWKWIGSEQMMRSKVVFSNSKHINTFCHCSAEQSVSSRKILKFLLGTFHSNYYVGSK